MERKFLEQFRTTLESTSQRLLEVPEAETEKPLDGGWSAKQILGHLIDSAANNHRRFVQAQLQDNLVFDGYDQEAWVRLQQYDKAAWVALVELWTEYNLHLLYVISLIPEATLHQERNQHSLDKIAWQPVPASQPTTLDYLIRDYFAHMQDHLQQILTGVERT